MESKVCSRSQGQPPGSRRRAMISTRRSNFSPQDGDTGNYQDSVILAAWFAGRAALRRPIFAKASAGLLQALADCLFEHCLVANAGLSRYPARAFQAGYRDANRNRAACLLLRLFQQALQELWIGLREIQAGRSGDGPLSKRAGEFALRL